MPLKKDKQGGGTNNDGSKSSKYCSHCYISGEFQNPEIDTAPKMQSFVKNKLKSMGFPGFIAGFLLKGYRSLKDGKLNKNGYQQCGVVSFSGRNDTKTTGRKRTKNI